jgi:hypothetical protein
MVWFSMLCFFSIKALTVYIKCVHVLLLSYAKFQKHSMVIMLIFIFTETNKNIVILFISGNNSFVVLLLHCGLESSLPRLPTASKLCNMEKYQNVEFIDVAFNINSKLYPCRINENARSQLQTFLNSLKSKV